MGSKENMKNVTKKRPVIPNDMVSIIMPSFNTASYIAQSIRSVQRQTYPEWELIIVDDCSTDNTDEIVFRFLDDKRIHYIKNEKNQGAALSRNRALREAQGRWVAFLDSDDIWGKRKLEEQLKFMKENNYHFTYTKYGEMDEKSRKTGIIVSGPGRITKKRMYDYCWPGCLTVMYDREIIGNLQIVDIKKNNDYAIWLKAVEKADCFFLNKCLALYRRGRKGSISTQGYTTLLKWHYRLFRGNGNSPLFSAYCTMRNIVFGMFKRIIYTKKSRK